MANISAPEDSLCFAAVDDEDKPMSAINKEKSNPLSSRQDVVAALNTLLGALDTQFPAGHSRFSLGDTCALRHGYRADGGLSRVVGAISADGIR
jgi:hypothetical protein